MTQQSNDLDLTSIVRIIWNRKLTIILSTVCVVFLALIWSLTAPKEYVVRTVVLSEGQSSQNLGRFSALASFAGIGSGVNNNGGTLSPVVYKEILSSFPFQKRVLESKINSTRYGDSITVLQYLIALTKDDKHRKIMKYTIGLPKFLKTRRNTEKNKSSNPVNFDQTIVNLSSEERIGISELARTLKLEIDSDNGSIKIECITPEPLATAQLNQHVKVILEDLVREFKITKAENELKFIEDLYGQKKEEYLKIQNELVSFQDANRIISNSTGISEQQRLQDKYNVAFSVYSQVANQLESKKIQVLEDTPVFSTIQPAIVPNSPVGPNHIRSVLVGFFIGIFFGLLFIFALETKLYIVKNW